MYVIIKTPVYNGFGYHLFSIMNDLLKEIPSLDPGEHSVTKSSDTQLLEKILNQLLITNSHLERIARRLDHESKAEFEGKIESRSTRGPRVEYGLEEEDFNCIEDLARKTKYSVEQSRPTSIQSERTQFMGVAYANRNELLASLVMSLYHTILDGDPMFRTVSRRPDFISFHSRGTSIVQGVAKALGNEKSAIPEIKDTSMQTLAGFLIREEKGEVFVIRPEVLQMIRDGAKTASLFGICEAIMLALSKVYELFPYPVCCLAAAIREPLVRGEGHDLEYNVDRDLVRKLLNERKDVSLTEFQSVKHANLALYIRLRLRTALTHESANKMVSTKSPEQVEKFMRTFSSQKSDPHPTKRKSATVKTSLTMV